MDDLLYSPFEIALGEYTKERLQTQFENYEYYQGRQHRTESGELVKASELERPAGLEYDPTRYATNYFKAIINRKARWQMGGKHGISVPRKKVVEEDGEKPAQTGAEQADNPTEGPKTGQATGTATAPDSKQAEADRIADGYERILHQLWTENKMRSKLIQAARDRLLAKRVVAKIVFNPNNGKLRWVFRPDTEFFPIYSDDDYEELIACHFIRQVVIEDGDDEIEGFRKQTFSLEGEGESRQCYVEEALYDAENLEVVDQIQGRTPMAIPFLPVVPIEVHDLLADGTAESEVADLREQNDVLNKMNEDAIDSLKFEMFSMTAVLNAPDGTADQMTIAPGAVLEARGFSEGQSPKIEKVEGGFRWVTAFKDQYSRVKSAMHEVSSLPQIVPQELNFGGLNGDALQVMFHDIISDTEEHWLAWEYGLKELHEKSIKYLQARVGEPMFNYDKEIVRKIEDYESEIKFVLPLPDNRQDLVDLLTEEMAAKLESQTGALERLGVEDVKAKQDEINAEFMEMQQLGMPVGAEDDQAGFMPSGGPLTPKAKEIKDDGGGEKRNSNGEVLKVCDVCGGSGKVISPQTGEITTCQNCRGDGVVQARKR